MSQCCDSDLLLLVFLDGAQHFFPAQTVCLWLPILKTVVKLPKLCFLRNIWNIYSLLEREVISYHFSTGPPLRLSQAPAEPTRSPPNQAPLPLPSQLPFPTEGSEAHSGENHQGSEEPPRE